MVALAVAGGVTLGLGAAALTFRSVTSSGSQALLAVTPVERSGPEVTDTVVTSLSAEILRELKALESDTLAVMAWRPTMSYDRTSRIIRNRTKPTGIDFVLEGGVEPEQSSLRASFRLLSVADGSEVWAGSFSLAATEPRGAARLIARVVAQTVVGLAARD